MITYSEILKQVKKMAIADQFKILNELNISLNQYIEVEDRDKVISATEITKSEQEWQNWDQQIEQDSKEGKLDFLIEEALTAKAQSNLRDL